MADNRNSTVGASLEGVHSAALSLAVRNVLSTDLALNVYAQLIDGLPITDVAWDQYGNKYDANHPVNSHTNLCPGSLEKATKFRDTFNPDNITLDRKKLEQFQNTSPSSRPYQMRLIELTAMSLHHIGVLLFQLENLHDPATTDGLDVDRVTAWERPPDQWARVKPWPTMFIQTHFTAHQAYPHGIADIAGYWAEDRILGGVPLFDRSCNWDGDQKEPNIYFQCCRYNVTFRVCQLLDHQQKSLLAFLRSDPAEKHSQHHHVLPILPGDSNKVRIDPKDAIEVHKVYRDVWEREPYKPRFRMQEAMTPCYTSSLDYPEKDVAADIERLNRLR